MIAAIALSACGGSVESDRIMIKYSGALQCQPSVTTQARLNTEISLLVAAGAVVNGGRCILDGLPHLALCGAMSGEAFEVAVAVESVPIAKQLGFEPADRYPDRKSLPCN